MQLLDEDGQIKNPDSEARLRTLNVGRSLENRNANTQALPRQGPARIASLQNRTAELVAAGPPSALAADAKIHANSRYRLKIGALTSHKVPSLSLRLPSSLRLRPTYYCSSNLKALT